MVKLITGLYKGAGLASYIVHYHQFTMRKDPYKDHGMYCRNVNSERSGRLGISPSSITEKVRSRIPSNPNRYDKNEKVDELYRDWSRSMPHSHDANYDRVLFLVYDLYKPRILSIAKNYRSLSPVFDDDDLLQTGLLGVLQALVKYDHAEHIAMKFSTYLEWSIRNVFQRAIGYGDKFVEVYDANDRFTCTMNYQDFLVKKKQLLSAGHTYTIKSKQCYISDERVEASPVVPAAPGAQSTDSNEHLEMI